MFLYKAKAHKKGLFISTVCKQIVKCEDKRLITQKGVVSTRITGQALRTPIVSMGLVKVKPVSPRLHIVCAICEDLVKVDFVTVFFPIICQWKIDKMHWLFYSKLVQTSGRVRLQHDDVISTSQNSRTTGKSREDMQFM